MSETAGSRFPFRRCGADVTIFPWVRVVSAETISVGDSVIIDDFVFLMGGEETRIGSFVHLASFSSLVGGGRLVLEDFAGISSGCRVYTGNDDYLGGSLTGPTVPPPFRVPERSFVHVGRHAVVGANTVILPGVTIGDGCVIGANSFVKSDCEPWTVYVGSPVRRVRSRRRDRILDLEAELRRTLYDASGQYVPRSARLPLSPPG
jgi:acetyltransferase-like isoleucine patch superfamily enzyme